MDIKSNKGLSMIAVIVVLALIIITIIETVIISKKWFQEEELEDLTTTMLLIQARCKTYKDKETMEDKKIKLKGTLISKLDNNDMVKSLIEKGIIKKKDKYYLLSKKDLEDLHVYEIDEKQTFLVNYETDEVIYANGIKKGNDVLYKLSDINSKSNNKEENIITDDNSLNNNNTTNKVVSNKIKDKK